MRTTISSALALSLMALGVSSAHAGAQDVRIKVYHGDRTSRAIEIDRGSGAMRTSNSRFNLVLPVGNEVCVEVVNSHPVLYRYALNASVDTTSPPAPDFSAVVSVLNQALAVDIPLPTDRPEMRPELLPMVRGDMGDQSWQNRYYAAMKSLMDDLEEISRAIQQSDLPEPLQLSDRVLVSPDTVGRGFAHAVRALETRRAGPFQFHDPQLAERVKALTDTVSVEVRAMTNGRETLMLDLLSQRFTALVEQRNTIRNAYMASRPSWEGCRKLEAGTNTLTLSVQRADTAMARRRDVGDSILTIHATTQYARPYLEMVPLALGRRASDVASLSLRNGVLTLDRDVDYGFRVGTAAVLNLFHAGERKEISFGPLLGIGVGGEGAVLSDFYAGAAFGLEDWFRVGAAWGWSRVPNRMVRPELLGTAPPENLGDFSELLEPGWRDGVYLIFSIRGLSFFERD